MMSRCKGPQTAQADERLGQLLLAIDAINDVCVHISTLHPAYIVQYLPISIMGTVYTATLVHLKIEA